MSAERSSVLAGLDRASSSFERVQRALSEPRVDLAGLPPGAAAWLLARASQQPDAPPTLVVVPDLDHARRMADNLRFFLEDASEEDEPARVLLYPAADTSPYLDVAPDRRAAMDRLAALFHLSHDLPWRFLVLPAGGLVRRVPPPDALAARSCVIRAGEELDRDALIALLIEGGYLRVPVAEDPGTFAIRGGIVDIFPPHATLPARIELDDWLVLGIQLFDPGDQRSVRRVEQIFVHPVRETILGEAERTLARQRVRALCDSIDLPTTRTRQILDDIDSGRTFYGLDGLLPAFYPGLATLFDYTPDDARLAVVSPTACVKAIEDELGRARGDRGAKVEAGAPAFPMQALYLDEAEAAEAIARRPLLVVHRLAVGGARGESESPLSMLEAVDERSLHDLGATDQTELVTRLSLHRAQHGRDEALQPVADAAKRWLDEGLRVVFTARTRTQADRLTSLLSGYEVPVDRNPAPYGLGFEASLATRARVAIGQLDGGFIAATEGAVFVTEEEVFGARSHRRTRKKQSSARQRGAFLEDLRELTVGDYVVHVDHGIGVYRGLERKVLAQTGDERLRGEPARSLEVLVIEYAGADQLFLPVTRLNQIQRFGAKDGRQPKLDRLGGSTFATKKARAERAVRQLADDLLKLYAERAARERRPLEPTDRAYAEFEATFPFDETPDQARAIEDVLEDLERAQPMDRLVCGDVGFGKTEVALRAAFRVAMSGRQVALLCPTTVLAQQHYLSFRARLSSYPLEVRSMSRFVPKATQRETLTKLRDGAVDVVIGTHRLLSKDVHFRKLGLLIVDEEQRFGVAHKERLKRLRTEVDVLTLSATPIPRTLQLAIGGLRGLSLITTPPVDRRAVRTFACRWDEHTIREAVERELARGGQVFYVYNRVDGLYERAQRLQDMIPDARIAVAHGQMKEGALERTMTDFVDGEYDILCSTAIVESGLDIPRANTMIIDRADMFGLAQLYQLRGRVGRSRERAYCYLITPPPSQMTDETRERIEALERFTQLGSGFHVASLDMELRGAGELLGAEQSGSVSLVGFDLFVRMLEDAVAELRGEVVEHEVDPELSIDVEHYLPDDYIDDVGLRLSFYKRLAEADTEGDVAQLGEEMEDRFGPPPPAARQLLRAMALKPDLRRLRALGCEAGARRVVLHLRQDTPLDPAKVMQLVSTRRSPWALDADMKLSRHFDPDEGSGDSIDRARAVLDELLERHLA
ncbi:MAG: transcription-repair coupling factor [Myxococcales bacterium]|nr:transcription-repair coupling factor [Myxococcales bacterium]